MKQVIIDITSDKDVTYVCPMGDVKITLRVDPDLKCRQHGLVLVPQEKS